MKLKNALGDLYDLFCKTNELILDSFDDVYYVQKGKICNAKPIFKNEEEVEVIANNLLKFSKIKKVENKFHYDFTLDEITRVNIVFPPMSQKGIAINILKMPKQSLTWDDMLKWNVIREEGVTFLTTKINEGKNFIVAGAAGSGKTTLMNIMASSINPEFRVVAIERTPSLLMERKRLAKIMAPNHKKEEMRELIEAAAKMRADYIVHSFLEGPETMDLIDLVRDGHSCIMLTSGENIYDAIRTIEFKALGCNYAYTVEDIRYKIANAFDYIVFQEKMEDSSRKITKVAQLQYDEGKIKLEIVYSM